MTELTNNFVNIYRFYLIASLIIAELTQPIHSSQNVYKLKNVLELGGSSNLNSVNFLSKIE